MKQRSKTNSPIMISDRFPRMKINQNISDHCIQQKPQKYESTSRQLLKSNSEMDEYIAKTQQNYQTNFKQANVSNRDIKRLTYDMISQSKSKKLSSFDNQDVQIAIKSHKNNQQSVKSENGSNLVQFLDSYVAHLQQRSPSQPRQISNSQLYSKISAQEQMIQYLKYENNVLMQGIYKQKKKNINLAKMIQEHRARSNYDSQRIRELQQIVNNLQNNLVTFKNNSHNFTTVKSKQYQTTNEQYRINQLNNQLSRFKRDGFINLKNSFNYK